MARSQEFNSTSAITAALDVFWARGYEGTSLTDLETATGLSRSSLYNSFGNKRGVFDAAVQMYLEHVIRPRLRGLTDNPTPDAVERYLTSLRGAIATMTPDSPRRGCLLLNAAAGIGAHDDAVAAVIRSYRQELSDAIASGLQASFPSATAATLADRTRILLSCTVSALVLARVDTAQASATLESARRLLVEWS
ncbi:TetR/AcrR family transcriptional regulator [Rhodococcus sp. IEGM 1366]|uniref:TetR family transcriptional regulator n=1 Tax=Nocardia globerula TaxID=1818 RepID=A0A652YTI5_NOCGL|nr:MULTISPECIES: TetR/AcrR family transcriptional regulator [Rhodococcus]MDV8068599.1 TetR/AcrR family transcriptional regulator [Rhodococcus sp. IEGM 1366]NMD61096.1 TetR/AcrR family transcriptional regulator [Nocardia globerula]PVX67350.1 TetR family transcriptional regulator [Rhodococcus globerulus]RZL27312.1 MAG: TetR/AcrR family transcriptional regulator [Rhodococcus sp. (in: high G+C Gram-positive bacteria)]